MEFYAWLENTPIGVWVRMSELGFPISLIVHAWAMAFLVGISMLLALGVLGMARGLLPVLLIKISPFIWITFAASLFSGVFLLSAYPAKALTNEVFYIKLVLIALALVLAVTLKNRCIRLPVPHEAAVPLSLKIHAAGILLAWFGTIVAGRLLAYTYSILTVS